MYATDSTTPARLTSAARESPAQLFERYAPRALRAEARVTRVGPSPTGAMHIGGVYAALVSERIAHQSNGVFFLRIEDTDKKREVAGAVELIIASLAAFDIRVDEGEFASGEQRGAYGPYRQSQRMHIYHAFARQLLEEGKAYACFATPEELEAVRAEQTRVGAAPGYYGQWALWRDRSEADVCRAIDAGVPHVIRIRAPSPASGRVELHDVIRGTLSFPENDLDTVLLKADGLPTYHFAHVVDDHLMGTTDVIRGEEWLSSVPIHLQLFDYLGWNVPRFAHISTIMRMDGDSRRKLSKRKDPEASVNFYAEQGYPHEAVIEYLLNLADPQLEAWRATHPLDPVELFTIDMSHMSRSGALFDLKKVDNLSKEQIARLSVDELFERGLTWAAAHDPAFAAHLNADPDYTRRVLGIDRTPGKVRKDVAKWSDLQGEIGYFFDEIFQDLAGAISAKRDSVPLETARSAVEQVAAEFDDRLTRDAWLAWMRGVVTQHGFAESQKAYKQNPAAFKGHFGDVAAVLRLLLTARERSPDLYDVMRAMGRERVARRLSLQFQT